MHTKITQGVKVSVETFYQTDYSRPDINEYNFAYRITIENLSENTVMLMRRHWHIYDSNGVWREVEGEGVIGQQPVIEPGQKHVYVSGCGLKSEIGKMHGDDRGLDLDLLLLLFLGIGVLVLVFHLDAHPA